MLEGSDVLSGEKFEVLTVNGEVIVLQNQLGNLTDAVQGTLTGEEGIHFLALGVNEGQHWDLSNTNGSGVEAGTPALTVGPPAVEEENSSDNLLGLLEEFVFPTTEDGTLLPTTVNAKMADGSHQRLTLFPQVKEGNITYMVQFENDNGVAVEQPQPPPPPPPPSASDTCSLYEKIDSIISKNEDIIKNSKKMLTKKVPTVNGLSRTPRFRQRSLIKNKNHSLFEVNVPSTNALYFPNEEALAREPSITSLPYLHVKDSLLNIPTVKNTPEITSPYAKNFFNLQKYLEKQKLQLRIEPKEININDTRHQQRQSLLNLPKTRAVPTVHQVSEPQEPKNDSEPDGIFIKTSPEYFTSKQNDHPLGSSENPIQLLQTGKTYHSRHPLSEGQLQRITSILKAQKFHSSVMPQQLYDPATNTRIVYRVVFPEDVVDKNETGEDPKSKRPIKRSRLKMKSASEEESPNVEDSKKPKPDDNPKTEESPPLPPPPKVSKVARTRSGRLSRPPRYMVRDYKRLQNMSDVRARTKEEDRYMDYRPTEEPKTDYSSIFSIDLPRAKLKPRNVRPEHRCPTCHKIYFGHTKMIRHLRKFPDHSNADEYQVIYQRARSERKARRINIFKLKQMLSGVDRMTLQETYGPFLADAFNLWDFLLLRVRLLKNNGIEEVEGLLKELTVLLEKLGKIVEELLSPAYSGVEDSNAQYVDLDKHEVAYALGLSPGIYKVNRDCLHLLKPTEEEKIAPPRPPSPKPTQLETKYEPNLSTKLLECSNDSIDLDCSSKDVPEAEDEKKDVEDTNSEFLSELLQSIPEESSSANPLPASSENGLNLWKSDVTPPPIWKENTSTHEIQPTTNDGLSLWKGEKLWKNQNGEDNSIQSWKATKSDAQNDNIWQETGNEVVHSPRTNNCLSQKSNSTSTMEAQNGAPPENEIWVKESAAPKAEWELPSGEKDGKKDWMKLWKEESGAPGLRTSRLTSTPESHGPAPFSPPLRRNSVSSFAPTHQEEFLSLDLNELFEDLMPDQNKQRRPKPASYESLIHEALFQNNESAPNHPSLPPTLNIISDPLDEVTNLDFLNQD